MKKRILSLLLAAVMLLGALASCRTDPPGPGEQTGGTSSTAGGTVTTAPIDTEKDPPSIEVPAGASVYSGTPDTSWFDAANPQSEYTLTSADQLVGFIRIRNDTKGAVNFDGITLKLGCDMVINEGSMKEVLTRAHKNHLWSELHSAYTFNGTLDGQGHMISGIYLSVYNSGIKGIFGTLSGNAVLKDFTIANSYLGCAEIEGKNMLGGLSPRISGEGSNVTISNVTVNMVIEERGGYTVEKVGGFIGEVSANCSLTMENCKFLGRLTISGQYAGGLVGYASQKDMTVTLTNCENAGEISAARYAGGLIGRCSVYDIVESGCKNSGTVSAPEAPGELFGVATVIHNPTGLSRAEALEGTTLLRVMSANITFNLPTEGDGMTLTQHSKNRLVAAAQEILSYDADIVGVQEDNRKWSNGMILDGYAVIQDSTLPEAVERSSIYYKKGLTVLKKGNVWLSPNGLYTDVAALTVADLFQEGGKYRMSAEYLARLGITKDTPDSFLAEKKYSYVADDGSVKECEGYILLNNYPRNATYGVFDINGQPLIVINTHLQQRTVNGVYSNPAFQKLRENERLKQLDYMKELIDKLKKEFPTAVVYMTGDWNDTLFSNVYNKVCNDFGFRDSSFAAAERYGIFGTMNAGFSEDSSKLGLTYPSEKYNNSGESLDYIFISDGIDVRKYFTGDCVETVVGSNGVTSTFYTSDHLPIIADICFKTERTGSPIDPDVDDPTKPSHYTGSADTSWYTGDKTEYELTTADQLMGLMYLRNQSSGAVTFEGVTIKLARDMIFNEGTAEEIYMRSAFDLHSWPEINSNYFFKGNIDGQGHTVSGIYMKFTTSGVKGIFGGVSGNATFKDIHFANVCFTGADQKKEVLGTLIAKVSGAATLNISNVTIEGVLRESGAEFSYIGGFIGRIEAGCTVTMENCEFKGTIDYPLLGTIIGGFFGGVNKNNTVIMKNCTFSGTINGRDKCAGIAGYVNASTTIQHSDFTLSGTINCPGIKGEYTAS